MDADTLDGMTSADLTKIVPGKAAIALQPAGFGILDPFPGWVVSNVTCGNFALPDPLQGNSRIDIYNAGDSTANFFIDDGSGPPDYLPLASDDGAAVPAPPTGLMLQVHVQWGDGTFANFTVSSIHRASDCHFQASGVLLR